MLRARRVTTRASHFTARVSSYLMACRCVPSPSGASARPICRCSPVPACRSRSTGTSRSSSDKVSCLVRRLVRGLGICASRHFSVRRGRAAHRAQSGSRRARRCGPSAERAPIPMGAVAISMPTVLHTIRSVRCTSVSDRAFRSSASAGSCHGRSTAHRPWYQRASDIGSATALVPTGSKTSELSDRICRTGPGLRCRN